MAAVKRSNTKPELRLRRFLHRQGYRFRTDYPVRTGGRLVRPDIAFTRYRVAVFVDGCFWHCCPYHRQTPATNRAFWVAKLADNVARDRLQTQVLSQAGWLVVRVWEHEQTDVAATRVMAAFADRR